MWTMLWIHCIMGNINEQCIFLFWVLLIACPTPSSLSFTCRTCNLNICPFMWMKRGLLSLLSGLALKPIMVPHMPPQDWLGINGWTDLDWQRKGETSSEVMFSLDIIDPAITPVWWPVYYEWLRTTHGDIPKWLHPLMLSYCLSITHALLTIPKKWERPRCPSTDGWMRKMCRFTEWNITHLLTK